MNYQKGGESKISELFNIAKNGLQGSQRREERLNQLLNDSEVDPNEISQHNPYNPLRLSMSNGRYDVFKILINHQRVNTMVDYIDPFHPGGQIDMGKEGLFDAILNCGDIMKERGSLPDYIRIIIEGTDAQEQYREHRTRNIIETARPIQAGDMSFLTLACAPRCMPDANEPNERFNRVRELQKVRGPIFLPLINTLLENPRENPGAINRLDFADMYDYLATPLHAAVCARSSEVVERLLQDPRVDPNACIASDDPSVMEIRPNTPSVTPLDCFYIKPSWNARIDNPSPNYDMRGLFFPPQCGPGCLKKDKQEILKILKLLLNHKKMKDETIRNSLLHLQNMTFFEIPANEDRRRINNGVQRAALRLFNEVYKKKMGNKIRGVFKAITALKKKRLEAAERIYAPDSDFVRQKAEEYNTFFKLTRPGKPLPSKLPSKRSKTRSASSAPLRRTTLLTSRRRTKSASPQKTKKITFKLKSHTKKAGINFVKSPSRVKSASPYTRKRKSKKHASY